MFYFLIFIVFRVYKGFLDLYISVDVASYIGIDSGV